eukprot:2836541-Amphidinium_carterae.1
MLFCSARTATSFTALSRTSAAGLLNLQVTYSVHKYKFSAVTGSATTWRFELHESKSTNIRLVLQIESNSHPTRCAIYDDFDASSL